MSSQVALVGIADELERELSEIESAFASCVSHQPVAGFSIRYGAGEDGCVVSLWDAWNRFMRSLFLTSCASTTIGDSSTVYTPRTVYNESAALTHLRQNTAGTKIRFTRSEPNWYATFATSDFCRVLSLPNSSVITGAVLTSHITDASGATVPNPIESIKQLRNFIAHKNVDTHRDISAFVPNTQDTRGFLTAPVTGGISQFRDWTSSLLAIAYAAVQ